MSRSGGPQIKNRAPAAIQITAEQLLREARERGMYLCNISHFCGLSVRFLLLHIGLDDAPKVPKQFITDKVNL